MTSVGGNWGEYCFRSIKKKNVMGRESPKEREGIGLLLAPRNQEAPLKYPKTSGAGESHPVWGETLSSPTIFGQRNPGGKRGEGTSNKNP